MWITLSSLIRILAISVVVLIHASSVHENGLMVHFPDIFQWKFGEELTAVILSQIARFCVPVFLILSGFALSERYSAPGSMDSIASIREFYKKRMFRVFIPYFFWTMLALFTIYVSPLFARYKADGWEGVWKLGSHFAFIRGADYHFYFLIIIFQMYVLFPLFARFRTISLWVLLGILHLILCSPSHQILLSMGIKKYVFPSTVFINWMFYFYTGMVFSRYKPAIVTWIKSKSGTWFFLLYLLSLGILLGEYFYYYSQKIKPDFFNHFQRMTVVFYSLTVWIVFFRFFPEDAAWQERFKNNYFLRNAKAVSFWGGLTFHVYLFHTLYLRITEWALKSLGVYAFTFSFVITLGLSFASAYLFWNGIQRLPEKWKKLDTIFGF